MSLKNDIQPEKKPSGFLIGLLFSVVLHALFLVYRFSDSLMPSPSLSDMKEPIEISTLPPEVLDKMADEAEKRAQKKVRPPEDKGKQIVETEDNGNRKIDPNAKYLSDHNQMAEKQTRAKQVDDFRKALGTGGKGMIPEKGENIPQTGDNGKGGEKKAEKSPDEGQVPESELDVADGTGVTPKKPKQSEDTAKAGVKRDWKTLSLKDLSVGGDGSPMAASDDALDDVPQGDRTILSTREYRYFSYYNRIKELLRQYWKPTVERKLALLYGKGTVLNEEELVTKVLVLLDDKGSIQKISRLGSSGVAELDEAAVESFKAAAPFPNPPKGIIEDDGFVRIRWDFILTLEAAPRIQFQNAGNVPIR